jgi:penicillin amidase
MAQLAGVRAAPGLAGPVSVARDDYGVPLVQGSDRFDLAYATGFIHAQDRYGRWTAAPGRRHELPSCWPARWRPTSPPAAPFRARRPALAAMAADERRFIERAAGVNDASTRWARGRSVR